MKETKVMETNVIGFENYTINTNGEIKNIKRKKPLKFDTSNGYKRIFIENKHLSLHVLLARHFIPNPENLPCVDHISKDKLDNSLENLRWVTHSTNSKNKTSHKGFVYEFFDNLPEGCICVDKYGNHELKDLYFDKKD